jgi:small ligand-binding sensory domain FIST
MRGVARFGDGLACGPDLVQAAERAVQVALAPLAGRAPDLLCVFTSGNDPDELVAAAERAAALGGAAATVGCSAGGVLAGAAGVEGEQAVSVLAAVLPSAHVRTFHLEVMRADAGAAVVGLPETQSGDVAVLLVDPWSFPTHGFVTQANAALPGVPVVGGLAGGPYGPGSTRLLVDGRTVDRGAVGVLLRGAGAVALVSQGCRPVGPPMTVTAAAGNVLHGLAGEPALLKVQQVVRDLPPQDQALASAGLQLGIAADEYADDHDFLVRGLLGTEPGTQGLVVGDLVEVGQTVRLQVRDAAAADAGLRALLAAHRRRTDDAPAGGALLFSCSGRGGALFGPSHGGASHDPRLVRAELGAQGLAGFFAGGELGPVAGRNSLHGFTASLLAFPA